MTDAQRAEVVTMLAVRLQPRAGENALAGWIGNTVKLRVTAPPVDGAANTLCITLLSKLLAIPVSRLALIKGVHSRNKVVRILGLNLQQVCARLDRPSSRLNA